MTYRDDEGLEELLESMMRMPAVIDKGELIRAADGTYYAVD